MLPSTGTTHSLFLHTLANPCYQLSFYEGGQSLYKGRQLNLYTWTNTGDRKSKKLSWASEIAQWAKVLAANCDG